MNKICTKCHKCFTNVAEEELFCAECGGKLEPLASGTSSGMNVDNRIHRGDNTSIAGDNISANTINNSSVTNNYTTIDETKKVCKCEISGRMVPILDIVECPKCLRKVASKYYLDDILMCELCHRELQKQEEVQNNTVDALKENQVEQEQDQELVVTENPIVDTIAPSETQGSVEEVSALPPTEAESTPNPVTEVAFTVATAITQPTLKAKKNSVARKLCIILGVVAIAAVSLLLVIKPQMLPKQEVVEVEIKPTGNGKKASSHAFAEKVTVSAPATPKKVSSTTPQPVTGLLIYEKGDYLEAEKLLKKEVAEGNQQSAYLLALIYKEGKGGVAKNIKQSFMLMKQSAENGFSDAYYDLAEMYRLGLGTEVNRANAKKWYEQTIQTDGKNTDLANRRLTLYK